MPVAVPLQPQGQTVRPVTIRPSLTEAIQFLLGQVLRVRVQVQMVVQVVQRARAAQRVLVALLARAAGLLHNVRQMAPANFFANHKHHRRAARVTQIVVRRVSRFVGGLSAMVSA